MKRYLSLKRLVLITSVVAAIGGSGALVVGLHAQTKTTTTSSQKPKMRSTTQAERKAAAERRKAARAAAGQTQTATTSLASPSMMTADALAAAAATLAIVPGPGAVPDYFGDEPNYANSPLPLLDSTGAVIGGGMKKFVDPLPSIPIAVPDTCGPANQPA